mmetsp:Transcript_12112/g.48742  ORF Transcript_12112/g.48742 Transcript_12112/m.48742 type:complete len:356 (+) Transcript_12112:1499-2566(+)
MYYNCCLQEVPIVHVHSQLLVELVGVLWRRPSAAVALQLHYLYCAEAHRDDRNAPVHQERQAVARPTVALALARRDVAVVHAARQHRREQQGAERWGNANETPVGSEAPLSECLAGDGGAQRHDAAVGDAEDDDAWVEPADGVADGVLRNDGKVQLGNGHEHLRTHEEGRPGHEVANHQHVAEVSHHEAGEGVDDGEERDHGVLLAVHAAGREHHVAQVVEEDQAHASARHEDAEEHPEVQRLQRLHHSRLLDAVALHHLHVLLLLLFQVVHVIAVVNCLGKLRLLALEERPLSGWRDASGLPLCLTRGREEENASERQGGEEESEESDEGLHVLLEHPGVDLREDRRREAEERH